MNIFLKIYLIFIWKVELQIEERHGAREIFHSWIHSPNVAVVADEPIQSQGQKLLLAHLNGWRVPRSWTVLHCFPNQEARLEVEQLGHNWVTTWDPGNVGLTFDFAALTPAKNAFESTRIQLMFLAVVSSAIASEWGKSPFVIINYHFLLLSAVLTTLEWNSKPFHDLGLTCHRTSHCEWQNHIMYLLGNACSSFTFEHWRYFLNEDFFIHWVTL